MTNKKLEAGFIFPAFKQWDWSGQYKSVCLKKKGSGSKT